MKVKSWPQTANYLIVIAARWLAIAGAVCIGIVMILSVIDVISSKFFNAPVPGTIDFIGELNVLLVFLPIAYLAQERGNIIVDIFEHFMSSRTSYALELFGYILSILIIGFCSWRSFALVQNAITAKIYKSGSVDFPVWPSNVVVFIGFTLLTLVFICLFTRAIMNGPKRAITN
jgi:TRAP-type C4-dicarboxylate transport system permease small subunit